MGLSCRLASHIITPLKALGSKANTCVRRQQQKPQKSIESLDRQEDVPANCSTYASLLQECGNRKFLAQGKQLHAQIIRSGMKVDAFLSNHLILMYTKCNSIMDARKVFDEMPVRNLVSWNSMIGGYSQHGHGGEAFNFLKKMENEGVKPGRISFISILGAFASPEDLAVGKLVHSKIIELGLQVDTVVGTALVKMYGKCGSIENARLVFDTIPKRDVVSWTVMIAAYARYGDGEEALKLFHQMQLEGMQPDKISFISVLNTCAIPEALAVGKLVHAHILDTGLESNVVIGTALVHMYGLCGSVEDAQKVFDKMPERDVVLLNAMITAYAHHGYGDKAFGLFQQMQQEGMKPDKITFIRILNACGSRRAVALGKLVHAHVLDGGLDLDIAVSTALVHMYGKIGSVLDARMMFDKILERDVVSWNAMIAAYSQQRYVEDAFKLFQQMQLEGVKPDKVTFSCILNACASLEALALGKLVHARIVDEGVESDAIIGTALLHMYGKCKCIKVARTIFDKISDRNVSVWNEMITVYAHHGYDEEAFMVFQQMLHERIKPDKLTLSSLLIACAGLEALTLGKVVHACMVDAGLELDVFSVTALMKMYGNCGSIDDARRIFDTMPERYVTSWNVLIAAYAQNGYGGEVCNLFQQMQQEGVKPDKTTFISILNACAMPGASPFGKLVHAHIVDEGLESDVVVGTAVVSMYGNCARLEDACRMFDKVPDRDAAVWNVMIAAYGGHGYGKEALKFFQQMQQEGLKPDNISFVSILNTCAEPESLALGKLVHAQIVDAAFESDVVVGTALVNMYVKCGSITNACRIFEMLPDRDVVLWTAMIGGYARQGHNGEAFKLFQQMQQEGVKPDKITFINILNACARPEALELGILVHDYMANQGFESDVVVGTALVNMYGNCGNIENAHEMFHKMPKRSVVSWNAMIAGYAQHGHGKEALQFFQQMQREGMKPDEITLISVLNACSHAGCVDEGIDLFYSMSRDHGLSPTMEHYNCMVDLLGRAGRLHEAHELINKMPFQPDSVTWMTLLGSCRIHGFIDKGKHAAEHVVQLDPHSAPPYVALSNIYAAAGLWNDAAEVQKVMADRDVKKDQGHSWIDVNNKVRQLAPTGTHKLCRIGQVESMDEGRRICA